MALPDFEVSGLSPETKKWLSYAIAGIICADKQVDDSELKYLKQAIGFLDDPEEIQKLVSMVKQKALPDLAILKLDRQPAFSILCYLTSITVSDGKLASSEGQFLKKIGLRLGFEIPFINELIQWAKQQALLDKELEKIWQIAKSSTAYYQ